MDKKVHKTLEQWREQLSPESYYVTREQGTERPYTGEYYRCTDKGVYQCIGCGEPLFLSDTKFDAGCGWPSFFQSINDGVISEHIDTSHGMQRIEVRCQCCDAHLGHVFNDGPQPTGLRYCINSVALQLDKQEK